MQPLKRIGFKNRKYSWWCPQMIIIENYPPKPSRKSNIQNSLERPYFGVNNLHVCEKEVKTSAKVYQAVHDLLTMSCFKNSLRCPNRILPLY